MSQSAVRKFVKRGLNGVASLLHSTSVGRIFSEEVTATSMARTRIVNHGGARLSFCAPNRLNQFRADTFATKEPETLAWLDSIPEGSVVWDVGANIGLYTCYAAAVRRCRVIAFEPSVFNLELLARNIYNNGLTDRVTVVPLPLYERVADSKLNMSSTQWGGALSTFDQKYGFDGHDFQRVFEFRTVGVSMDDCVEKLSLPPPEYLKMDVDGIEHVILRGASAVLSQIRGVQVEISDSFEEQAEESARLLSAGGLRFIRKAHSQMIEDNPTFRTTFNQVWER